jgi:hypothetical protein
MSDAIVSVWYFVFSFAIKDKEARDVNTKKFVGGISWTVVRKKKKAFFT